MPEMVEDEKRRRQHEHRLGQAQRISLRRGQALKVVDGFVGQVADRAAVEPLQRRQLDHLKARKLLLYGLEGVDRAVGLARTGLDDASGLGSEEAVSGDMLSALDALQQERVGRPRYLEVGGYGRLQVGVDLAINWDEVALLRQPLDFF